MLSQTVFPPDIRLEKEIRTLSENGYEVLVLCNQYEKEKNPAYPYCEIVRVKAPFENIKLNKIINFPIFFNPRFLLKAVKTAMVFQPDFIHAHDLPTVPLGYVLKQILNKPLIYDMHENYPDALREFKKKGIFNFLFKNPAVADVIEKFNLKVADRIITVVEENRERLIKQGVASEKIAVVSNTIDLETFVKSGENKENDFEFVGKKIMLYTGTVSPERGLETPVNAMKIVQKKIPEALFIIVGDGPSTSALKEIVEKNNLHENVKLIPWQGHEKLWRFISQAKICVIPQPSNDFIDNTIPHKLFEYMSFEKPVLVSDAKPLKRIISETGCGLFFKSHDYNNCAEKVIELLQSENIEDFGKSGKEAVIKKYNWKRDAESLTKLYGAIN